MSGEPILPPERSSHNTSSAAAIDDDFASPFVEGQLLLDKYRIRGLIGTGGIGYVMSAVNIGLDEPVALKFLRPELLTNQEAVHRFMTEARLASKIQSPHVTRVLDVCTLPEHGPFIVMDLLVGRDLNQILQAQGPLSTEVAVDYVLQACEALAAAHACKILHRDVKPDNLFLCRQLHGPDIIKILDFGISKLQLDRLAASAEASPFHTTAAIGSPSYMSPEQIRADSNIDERADVWSLGCVLYELLAGQHAFNAPTLMQICAVVLEQAPPPIRMHVRGVPLELEKVLQRCLEKEPVRRYDNVAELAEALTLFAPPTGRGRAARCREILGHSTASLAQPSDASPSSSPPTAVLPAVESDVISRCTPTYDALRAPAPLSTAPVALEAATPSALAAHLPPAGRNGLGYAALAVALVALVVPQLGKQTQRASAILGSDTQRVVTQVQTQTSAAELATPEESASPLPATSSLSQPTPATEPTLKSAPQAGSLAMHRAPRKPSDESPTRANAALQRVPRRVQLSREFAMSQAVSSPLESSQLDASAAGAVVPKSEPVGEPTYHHSEAPPLTASSTPPTRMPQQSSAPVFEAKTSPDARVSPETSPHAPNALSQRALLAVVRAHVGEVQACRKWAQGEGGGRSLKVVVTIDADGNVILVQPYGAIGDPAQLIECLVATTKRWKFPARSGPAGLHSYTLTLE